MNPFSIHRFSLAFTIMLGLSLEARAMEHPAPGSRATVDLAMPVGDEVAEQSLDLELGKSVFVRSGFKVKRVSVGDPEVLDVVVLSPREIQLVPNPVVTGTRRDRAV